MLALRKWRRYFGEQIVILALRRAPSDGRCTPRSGHSVAAQYPPLWAIKRHCSSYQYGSYKIFDAMALVGAGQSDVAAPRTFAGHCGNQRPRASLALRSNVLAPCCLATVIAVRKDASASRF